MEFRYVCSQCHEAYPIGPEIMVCPACAAGQEPDQPLLGVLEVELTGRAGPDFRIADLLPLEAEYFPPLPVGGTPLWEPRSLRQELGLPNLYLKDDGANPTGSFKDRASFLVSALAARHGIREIVLASTGNAGSSMAGVGAAAGQRVILFLPHDAPRAKLVQALQYGARVFRVEGTYDRAYDLSLEYVRRFGGLSRSTAFSPMTLEGKKTVSLELFRQLKLVPDYVFIPAGDGCILGGAAKGFRDLVRLGITDRVPTLVAVQASGSDALAQAFESGVFTPRPGRTVADSISVAVPRNGFHALKQLNDLRGRVITVSDQEIISAQARLARTTGLFTEPAGAAALAGLLKLSPELDPETTVVVLATGNGLKDIDAAVQGVELPPRTIRSLDDL